MEPMDQQKQKAGNIVGHQFAVFLTGQDSLYAINVAKIKAFIITADVTISDTPSDSDVVAGIATIRGEPITLVNLDKWLGIPPKPTEEYKLILYCEFSHKKIGFLVKDMVSIIEKSTTDLRHLTNGNSKITHTMYTKYQEKDELCTVFNAEQLLQDIGLEKDTSKAILEYKEQTLPSEKTILVAEDSQVARSVLTEFLDTVKANYIIFNDGQLLIDWLKEHDTSNVGLLITDIEMPKIDGYDVVAFMKSTPSLEKIPVIVNSSMATNAVTLKMKDLGASAFVEKTDIPRLYAVAKQFLLS
jgi:two-component system chemotaxis response regulator CheV